MRIKSFLYKLYTHSKWKKGIRLITPSLCNDTLCISNKRILVIAPHADDELIGCYSVLHRHRDNTTVFCCSMTGSNTEQNNKRRREREFLTLCETIGVKAIVSEKNTTNCLLQAIIEINPDVIYVPSLIDWHDEHRLVNRILEECLVHVLSPPIVVWYQVSVPISCTFTNCAVEMSSAMHKKKWELFQKIYVSQQQMNFDRFAFIEKNLYRSRIIEPFYVPTKDERLKALSKEEEFINKLSSIKSVLNDPPKLIEISNQLYDSMLSE